MLPSQLFLSAQRQTIYALWPACGRLAERLHGIKSFVQLVNEMEENEKTLNAERSTLNAQVERGRNAERPTLNAERRSGDARSAGW